MKLMRLAALWFVFFAAAVIGTASPAFALTRAQIPTKMGVAFGASAGPSYIRTIPVGSQIGIQNCAASFTDGFPPLTFTPSASGGCPPFGQDFNGLLNVISLWEQWASAGGPMPYDAAFQTAIGGYPRDALIQSNILHGRVWYSTADNNLTNPDDQTGAAVNWVAMPGTNTAGTPVPSFTATAPQNTVSAQGKTVGNASSNATARANADCYWLFVYMWTNCSYCTLFNSAGGVIARGASAAADWNANDAIATFDMRGAGLIGADASGSTQLSGVPVQTGSTTAGGSIVGENLHALTGVELAVHSHTISDPGHAHGITDPTHVHGYSDPGHVHGISDPGHAHGITDPGHSHGIGQNPFFGGTTAVGFAAGGTDAPASHTGLTINAAGTGISINAAATGVTVVNHPIGITIAAAATGISVNAAVTGITATNNAGSGVAHNTVHRNYVMFWNLAL